MEWPKLQQRTILHLSGCLYTRKGRRRGEKQFGSVWTSRSYVWHWWVDHLGYHINLLDYKRKKGFVKGGEFTISSLIFLLTRWLASANRRKLRRQKSIYADYKSLWRTVVTLNQSTLVPCGIMCASSSTLDLSTSLRINKILAIVIIELVQKKLHCCSYASFNIWAVRVEDRSHGSFSHQWSQQYSCSPV